MTPNRGGWELHQSALPTVLLSLGALVVVGQLYVAIPLIPAFEKAFSVSADVAAMAGTAFGLAYAVGFLVFGPVSDRRGRKAVLVPGLIALAVVTLVIAASPTFAALVGLRALQGFAAATFAPAALAYLAEALPADRRATAIGWVGAAFLLAGVLGQVYAGATATVLGWPWVFVIAAPALILLAWAISRLPESCAPEPSPISTAYRSMAGLVRTRPLLGAYAAAFTLLLTFVAMYTGLAFHVAAQGLEPGSIALVRAAAAPAMLAAPFAGTLVGRVGPARAVVAGLGLAAGGLLLEAAASDIVTLVAGTIVFVAGVAVAVPSLITFVGSTAAQSRGAAVALYAFTLFVGASLGPLVATRLGLSFASLCGLLAVLLLLGAAALAVSTLKRPST
jgi:YNFM family putative membrane transporter